MPDGISRVGLEAPVIVVGRHTTIRAIVHGTRTDRVGAGIPVRWSLPARAGTFDDTISFTDAEGGANMGWLPPTAAGEVAFEVIAGEDFRDTLHTYIVAGPVARVELSADSIRFTRIAERPLHVAMFDGYENRLSSSGAALTLAVSAGSMTARRQSDSLYVSSGNHQGTGEITLSRTGDGEVLKRLTVVADLVVHTIEFTAGPDSLELAVGELFQYNYAARDSGGFPIAVTAADLGIQFASANPSIASIDAAGLIEARDTGSTVMTATLGDISRNLPVRVVGAYDLGALTPLYSIPTSIEGRAVGPVLFARDGASAVMVHNYAGHPFTPIDARVTWYGDDGEAIVERAFAYSANVTMTPDGATFVSAPLSRYDSQGQLVWTSAVNGRAVVADTGMVVVGGDGFLRAYTRDGAHLWTHAAPSVSATPSAVSAAGVFAWIGDSLVSVTRDGTVRWSIPSPGLGIAAADGMYFGRVLSTLRAIGQDGSTRWTFESTYHPTFALGPDGTIIVGTADRLHWLDRATGLERFSVPTPFTYPPQITVVGPRLYASDGYLFAYDAMTGEYLGRTPSSSTGGPAAPVCTDLGLGVASATQVARYARCQ